MEKCLLIWESVISERTTWEKAEFEISDGEGQTKTSDLPDREETVGFYVSFLIQHGIRVCAYCVTDRLYLSADNTWPVSSKGRVSYSLSSCSPLLSSSFLFVFISSILFFKCVRFLLGGFWFQQTASVNVTTRLELSAWCLLGV